MFVLVMKFIEAVDLLMNTGDSGDSSGDRVSTMGTRTNVSLFL